MPESVEAGDVVQVTNERPGLVGAFLYVEELHSWGVEGFVHQVDGFDNAQRIYLRLKTGTFERVGKAPLQEQPDLSYEQFRANVNGWVSHQRHLHAVQTGAATAIKPLEALHSIAEQIQRRFAVAPPDYDHSLAILTEISPILPEDLRQYGNRLLTFANRHGRKLQLIIDSHRHDHTHELLRLPVAIVLFERLQTAPAMLAATWRNSNELTPADLQFLISVWDAPSVD